MPTHSSHRAHLCVCHASLHAYVATFFRLLLYWNTKQLSRAGLFRSPRDLERLADSIDIYHVNGQVFIHSTIDGIAKPKIVPTGDQARYGDAIYDDGAMKCKYLNIPSQISNHRYRGVAATVSTTGGE